MLEDDARRPLRKPVFIAHIASPFRYAPSQNPYAAAAIYARIGSTLGTEKPPGTDLVHSLVLSDAGKRSVPVAIMELLTFVGLPIPRRAIEAVLTFEHGFGLNRVTRALDEIRQPAQHRIWFDRKRIFSGIKETQVFCCGTPSVQHLEDLHSLLDAARDMIMNEELKVAGERWARRWLIANGFGNVTNVRRLGKIRLSYKMRPAAGEEHRRLKLPEHSLDVEATERSTGIRFGVSVKNQRSWMTRGDKAIPDVFTKAKEHGLHPMLFVPFPDAGTIERCRDDGIRLQSMDAQIVLAENHAKRSMRSVINDLRPVLGPQPYVFMLKRQR